MGNCIQREMYDELPAYAAKATVTAYATAHAYGPTAHATAHAYGPPPPYNLTINLETKMMMTDEVKASANDKASGPDSDYAIYCFLKSGVLTHGPHKFTKAQVSNWVQILNPEKSVNEQYYFYARQPAPIQYSQNDEFGFAVYERKQDVVIPHPHVYTRAEADVFCRRANDFNGEKPTDHCFFVVRQPMHVSCAALLCPCGAKQFQKCIKQG